MTVLFLILLLFVRGLRLLPLSLAVASINPGTTVVGSVFVGAFGTVRSRQLHWRLPRVIAGTNRQVHHPVPALGNAVPWEGPQNLLLLLRLLMLLGQNLLLQQVSHRDRSSR